jgi:hypothetical protein
MAKAAAVSGSLSSTIINAATYKGTWNAFSDTPTLTNGVGTLGDAYSVTTSGTSGEYPEYVEQDWRIYNGATWVRVDKTTTTQWTIKPAIGGIADKEARQKAKLDLAQLKRRGFTLAADGTVVDEIVNTLTTTSAQSYSDGASMATFRVLNRGGNWDEFFANWDNDTWSCDQFPGSVVTNMTNPGDDSPIITITGGTFVTGTFYSFTGDVLAAGTPDTTKPFYRVRNEYDINLLPTQYVGNTAVKNTAPLPLQQGRPWIELPLPVYVMIMEDENVQTLETGFDDFVTE